jgi:hypothetical protein
VNFLDKVLGKTAKAETQRQNRLFAAAELRAEFDQLRLDAPAGAYLFAFSLFNTRNFLQSGDEVSMIVRSLKEEIRNSSDLANKLDGGLSVLAQQYTVAYLTTEYNKSLHKSTFDHIANAGNSYRDLLFRDSEPPRSLDSRKSLAKGGHACVMDLIKKIASERDELIATNPEKRTQYELQFEEDKQTMIAFYDVREEAASGSLGPHIVNLKSIIACL